MIEIGQEGLNGAVDLLKAIYTDSPIGIEIYDSKGKLIDLNQSCMELFGVSNKDDVKGFDLFNDPNIPKDHLIKLRQRETIRYESTFDFDLVKKHNLYRSTKSGKIFLDVLITPLFIGEDKAISNYLVQIQDSTDRKIAEHKLIDFNEALENRVRKTTRQLRKSEEDWRLLVEEAPDIIFTVDRNRRILYINKVPRGITQEQTIGTDTLNYVDPIYHETVKNSIENVFQTGESDYYEISARGPDDNTSWYSTRLGAIKQDEEIVSVMLITRDITERKKMEQKLKESEEKFRSIAEASLMGITIVQNNHIKYVNQQAAHTMGYTVSEMLKWDFKKILKNIHPDDLGLVMENMKKVLTNSPDSLNQLEYRALNKAGKILWVANYGSQIQYEGKTAQLITSLDITKKKLSEEKLMESEEKFRTITEQSLMGIAILQNDQFIYINRQFAEIFEYTPDGMKNWGKLEYAKLIHPDDKQMALEQARKKQLGLSGAIIHYQFKGITKNGSVKWLEIYSNGFNYRGGVADLINIIDITEKKEAEQELENSETKYRNFIENFQGIAFQGYQDFTAAFFHGEVEKISGYNEDDFVSGRIHWNQIIHPDDIEEINDKIDKFHERTDQTDKREYRIICKNGKIRWVTEYNQKFYDKVKNREGVRGVIFDITERKKIEERVHEEREKAEMYLNLVNVVIVALDRDGNISMINQKGYDILGWDEGELIGKSWFENCLPSRDRERVKDYFKNLVKGEFDVIPFYENSVLTKKGEEKLITWSTILVRDLNGKITSVLSSGEDITERKEAEEKIRESEKRLKGLIEAVPVGISITNPEGKIIDCNSTLLQYFGYNSKVEYLETPVMDLYRLPSDREKL
ncbi:MAG: PAS domain S-box protein, partial [Promethearchaeota archaeon]